MKKTITRLLLTALLSTGILNEVKASSQPYIGELMLFGGNFCPRGWANADGQLLAISQYSALFSLFGTIYGGDGRTTFGLPDLKGRSPIHVGAGAGLPATTNQGAKGGTASFTLTVNQMPNHNHSSSVLIKKGRGVTTDATNKFFAESGIYRTVGAGSSNNGTFLHGSSITINNNGGGQSVNKRSPYQVIRYCVALTGVFPSRN